MIYSKVSFLETTRRILSRIYSFFLFYFVNFVWHCRKVESKWWGYSAHFHMGLFCAPIFFITVPSENISVADNVELPHNQSNATVEFFEYDEDWAYLRPIGQSTPIGSTENLSDILEDIRPFQQAPPRQEGSSGRRKQKSTILTSDESLAEAQTLQDKRDAKTAAAEARKQKTAARKEAAVLKKVTADLKKAAKTKPTTDQPARISKRRKTVASYVEQDTDPEDN